MKKHYILLLVLALINMNILAQSGFTYQAALRNDMGKLRTNETIDLTVEILQDNTVIFTENQSVTTNAYGVFSFIVGKGTGSDTYNASFFLNNDSTQFVKTYLNVSEGDKTISHSEIVGVPMAEVAKVALKAFIDFPAGTIVAFGGDLTKIPKGWLPCDGTAYPHAAYPSLYAAIGTNWGGDENLFRTPDLRGVFLRGVNPVDSMDVFYDTDAGTRTNRHPGGNVGDSIGSYQMDELKAHSHISYRNTSESISPGTRSSDTVGADNRFSRDKETTKTGGTETRPKNAFVHYIIKY